MYVHGCNPDNHNPEQPMTEDIRAMLARAYDASPSLPGEPARLPAPAPLVPAPALPVVPAQPAPRLTVTGNLVGAYNSGGCPLGRRAVDVTGLQPADALAAAGLAWSCASVPVKYETTGGLRTSDPDRIWFRSDTGDRLGCFGNRRQPRQPADYLEAFQSFHSGANGALGPMHLAALDGGRTLVMAARIADNDDQGPAALGDRTDSWLMLTDHYGDSLSGRLMTWSNELVCNNGMVRRCQEHKSKLNHYGTLSSADIRTLLEEALQQNQLYREIKERLISVPMDLQTGENFIRRFWREQEQVANKIVRIYRYNLRGGELPTRQGTAWRLMSAVTQYTSHERSRDEDRRILSQMTGSRARTAAAFEAELLAAV
jgi:hypothetical protein